MSSKRQRYLANLHERYSEELQQLPGRVWQLLTDQRLDQLGSEMADYIASYRAEHNQGPTRRELAAALNLVDRLVPIPQQLPTPLHGTWRSTILDRLLAIARWRGWITYTGQARSLQCGKRRSGTRSPRPRPQ